MATEGSVTTRLKDPPPHNQRDDMEVDKTGLHHLFGRIAHRVEDRPDHGQQVLRRTRVSLQLQ